MAAPYETSSGKAERAARRKADDSAPVGAPSDVAPGELGDHQRRTPRIDLEHLDRGRRRQRLERPTEPVALDRLERVLAPPCRVVHQDLDRPEGGLSGIEQLRRRCRVPEVRLDSLGPTACVPDRADDVRRRPGPDSPDTPRDAVLGAIVDPQVAHQNVRAATGQTPRRSQRRCRGSHRSRSRRGPRSLRIASVPLLILALTR